MYVVLTQWLVPNILQWATNMQQYKNQVENQKERAKFDKAKVWSLCSPPWVSQKVSWWQERAKAKKMRVIENYSVLRAVNNWKKRTMGFIMKEQASYASLLSLRRLLLSQTPHH